MIQRALRFEYPDFNEITIKNESGEAITYDSVLRIADPTPYALDYYQNTDGTIVEAVIRSATEADRAFQQRLQRAANDGPELRKLDVDCSDKAAFLQQIFDRDQASRRAGTIDRRTDHENLERITSFLDKCGVPNRSEIDDVQRAAIWAVLQHGPRGVRQAYLPQLEAAAERGDLDAAVIAMMRDRLLVEAGQPQVYGTQVGSNPVTGESFLHPLVDSTTVDRRRAEVGLGPLREYLMRWNIAFTTEQR